MNLTISFELESNTNLLSFMASDEKNRRSVGNSGVRNPPGDLITSTIHNMVGLSSSTASPATWTPIGTEMSGLRET